MPAPETRDRILEAADALIYRQGFAPTSFADIAAAVGLSRGNFYYHFRSKDAILDAVIARRQAATRAMLAQWEAQDPDPAARIRAFIDILARNRSAIIAHGCPVGTLSNELAKLGHPLHGPARDIFALFRDWLAAQFAALGLGDRAEALALHLLARSQGVATLATAFGAAAFVQAEIDDMKAWLDARLAEGKG